MRSFQRLAAVAAILVAMAAVLTSSQTGAGGAPTGVPIRFSHGHLVDIQRLAGEPALDSDSEGNLYVTGPIGVQYAQSFLWKSEDGGRSFDLLRAFPPLQRPMPSLGSGDSDTAILPPRRTREEDAVVWSDMINLAGLANAATFNGGHTFPPDYWSLFATEPGADRQWLGAMELSDGTPRVYQVYNQVGLGGLSVIYSDNYGQTWQVGQRGIDGFDTVGNIVADPVRQRVYIAYAATEEGEDGEPDRAVAKVAAAGPGADDFKPAIAGTGRGSVANLFVSVDTDTAGNVYTAWIESGGARGVYMAASTDGGKTWGRRIKVNTSALRSNVFPWIVAGDPGRVWVVWYGTGHDAPPPENRGPWNLYGAQSLNALGATPTFRQVKISEHPMHDNEVCLSGLGCSIEQPEDRNLLDDFTADIDPDGMLHVSYNDTNNQLTASPDQDAGGAFVVQATQEIGPSLYASKGTVLPSPGKPRISTAAVAGDTLTITGRHTLPAGNWSPDRFGDGRDPNHGPSCPCESKPFMDIYRAGLSVEEDGSMIAHLHLKEVPATPQEVTVQADGRTVLYQLFFWVDGRVYFTALESDEGLAYAGEPSFVPNQAGIPKILAYHPVPGRTLPVPAEWDGGGLGSIHWELPPSLFGDPAPGTRFDQVTGFVHVLEGKVGTETAMQFRDSTGAASWDFGDRFLPAGRVEVSVDDPNFTSGTTATLVNYPGQLWKATIDVSGLAAGTHTVYARQIVERWLGPVVSRTFTIGGG